MFHPSRGGVRGGQDQFSWDNVKEDKYRENYLGHSLKAPVGRWQKGKNLTWYAEDDKGKKEAREKEIQAIKEAEEEAMLEALGYPVKKKRNDTQIDPKELQNVLQKGREFEEADGQTANEIKGLGFKDSHSKSLTGKLESTKFTSSIATIGSQQPTNTNASLQLTSENNIGSPVKSHFKQKSKKKEKKSKSKHKHKEKNHKYKSDTDSGGERTDRTRQASSLQPRKDHYSNQGRNSRSPSRHDNERFEGSIRIRDLNRETYSRRDKSPVYHSRYSQRERSRRYSRSRSPARHSRDYRRDRK